MEESVRKKRSLTREQLGIVDSAKDVYETGDVAEPGSETQQLQLELEASRKSKEDRPSQPGPIDRGPLEPSTARSLFQTRDAVCLPPESDFSHEAHERKRDEWRILGSRQRALETPLDRYTRLVAEAQALERDLQMAEDESAVEGKSTEQLYPAHIRQEVSELVSRVEQMQHHPLSHPQSRTALSGTASANARLTSLARRLQEAPQQAGKGGGGEVESVCVWASGEGPRKEGEGGGWQPLKKGLRCWKVWWVTER